MECRDAEELLVPYLLGALDRQDRRRVREHLEGCAACSMKLEGDGEVVARLAYAVPQVPVPPEVKERLMARVAAEEARPRLAMASLAARATAWLRGASAPRRGVAFATALTVAVALLAAWFNLRLDHLADRSEELDRRVASVAEKENLMDQELEAALQRDHQLLEMIRQQRYLTYMAASPGVTVSMLSSAERRYSGARGMIVMTRDGSTALLAVLDLPPLPPDKVYQVWLIKGNQRYSAGVFTVDSTGYGQTVIIPVAPLGEYDAIGITVEPAGGSPGPTGTSVLKGDL